MPLRIWREPLDLDKTKIRKAEIRIIKERCRGCGFCIEFCPKDVLDVSEEVNERGAHPPKLVDETRCALCSFCQTVCPDVAIITIEKDLERGLE